jgi:K+ transporter
MQNGVILMGVASLLLMIYSHGSVSTLVVMYSINVFATFSLSNLGMARFFIKNRKREKMWKKHLPINLVGLALCLTILIITTLEKFTSGGWLTLVITSMVVGICYLIRRHYNKVKEGIRELDEMLLNLPTAGPVNQEPLDPKNVTAVQLVAGFNGFGVHTLLSIIRYFPNLYKNVIFVSIAVADSGSFKGKEEVEALKESTKESLMKYVDLARRLGIPADYRFDLGTDVVESASLLGESIVEEFPRSTIFMGQLIFPTVQVFNKLLHNETAYAIQRRLQWKGIPTMILPIRVEI